MNMIDRARESRGLWLRHHVRDLAGWTDMTARVVDAIVDGVTVIRGPEAGRTLRARGIQRIHEVIDAREVGRLRDHVLDQLRQPLLAMAAAVGRKVLGWDGDFYVDDYLILRINFPYEVARLADSSAENPGIGRLSPPVRDVFRARKTIDPVFDPKSYHRGHPPAAWAHGPHLDSWAGHSRDGRNIWWAIGDVPAEAGMVLYPELADENLPCEPKTLYLAAGYPLPTPTYLPLAAGEMLVFDPEVLHGTHLNTTGETRVAVSMRLNASKPTFDPACFYAREFWRCAADIEAGRDEVLHLRREDNLGAPVPPRPVVPHGALPVVAGRFDAAAGIVRADIGEGPVQGARLMVEAPPHRILVARTEQGLKAYDAACPHYGVDLADGGSDEAKTYCPACAVGFDLATGLSACKTLALRSYDVRQAGGTVELRVAP